MSSGGANEPIITVMSLATTIICNTNKAKIHVIFILTDVMEN